jgi:hypothetical protein
MEPKLLTVGRIAQGVGEPLHRVLHILRTRPHIKPAARAGTLRLYRAEAVAQVQAELAAIDSRRQREVVA